MIRMSTTTKRIHLQGIGLCEAKPASEFLIGQKMLWNYGAKSIITGVKNETKSYITYIIADERGLTWDRRLKKTRLVATA